MKYVITFHNKLKDGVPRDQTLIFGEYDIKGVAKKCFEAGMTGNFDSVSFKRVNNNEEVAVYCDDCILLDICGIEGCFDESMTYCDYRHRFIDKKEIIDDIKAEFASLYPKNYAGEPELGGSSCEFSLNKVYEIIDKHISGKEIKNDT